MSTNELSLDSSEFTRVAESIAADLRRLSPTTSPEARRRISEKTESALRGVATKQADGVITLGVPEELRALSLELRAMAAE